MSQLKWSWDGAASSWVPHEIGVENEVILPSGNSNEIASSKSKTSVHVCFLVFFVDQLVLSTKSPNFYAVMSSFAHYRLNSEGPVTGPFQSPGPVWGYPLSWVPPARIGYSPISPSQGGQAMPRVGTPLVVTQKEFLVLVQCDHQLWSKYYVPLFASFYQFIYIFSQMTTQKVLFMWNK